MTIFNMHGNAEITDSGNYAGPSPVRMSSVLVPWWAAAFERTLSILRQDSLQLRRQTFNYTTTHARGSR